MIFVYLSGRDVCDSKVEKLNEYIKNAKSCAGQSELSPADEILIIPNLSSVRSGDHEAICLEIRMSSKEPGCKAAAIARIIQEKLTVSAKTRWKIMIPD